MTLNKDHKWTWKPIEDLDLDPVATNVYQKIINKREVKQVDREDRLIWATSKVGKYTTKSLLGCFLLTQSRYLFMVSISRQDPHH